MSLAISCQGHPVKQADTVMLGYPLGLPMTPEVRRNDLEAYEPVTDPDGPAMTWVNVLKVYILKNNASLGNETILTVSPGFIKTSVTYITNNDNIALLSFCNLECVSLVMFK